MILTVGEVHNQDYFINTKVLSAKKDSHHKTGQPPNAMKSRKSAYLFSGNANNIENLLLDVTLVNSQASSANLIQDVQQNIIYLHHIIIF